MSAYLGFSEAWGRLSELEDKNLKPEHFRRHDKAGQSMNNYLLFTCGANMYVLLTGLGVLRESVRQYFWVFPGRCFQSTWESIGGV